MYRRQIIITNKGCSTRKSSLARFLSIQIGVRNYVTLQDFSTDNRANALIFYLSKFQK